MLKQKTLTMTATNGYVVQLDPLVPFGSVSIRASAICFVKLVSFNNNIAAPSTPTDPTPAAGATCDFYKMAAGEVKTFGVECASGTSVTTSYTDTIQYVVVWATANGDLAISAH